MPPPYAKLYVAGQLELAEEQPATLDQQYIRSWILNHYASCQFTRHLTQTDLQVLEGKAGLQPGATADPNQWAAFREWFAKSLRALQQVHHSCLPTMGGVNSQLL